MHEIKQRTVIIGDACLGKYAPSLLPVAALELCYLQLRMICELIALSSLLAHGDIEAVSTRKTLTRYEADWILDRLFAIHPDFYPQPIRLEPNHVTKTIHI